VLEEPIELLFYSGSGTAPVVASPRSVVVAERDSRATIVETHAGAGGISCTNAVTEVVLGAGSQIELVRVQREPETAYHFGLLEVRQEADSHFRLHSVTLGAATSRVEVRVRLVGQHAVAELDGLYVCHGDQQHDNPVLVEHVAPHCTSRQLYKGVVDEHGHGVFNGHIIVRHGAFGTDDSQTNKNLLLSDHAEIDTRPRLEILADDVKCSHGAAVGRLDDDALFYLQSRGIPEVEARTMLTVAFAAETVEHISVEPVRAAVAHLIAERLSGPRRAERPR
jgi:Fe-S cluster assembly protein SufD